MTDGTFRKSGIYRRRWQWWFPWSVTDWWKPRTFRGGDEWSNDSACLVLPPFGCLVVFWRSGPLRAMPCPAEWAEMTEDERADYAPCGYLHGGRIRQDAHHHAMTDGVCEWARAWLDEAPEARASRG